MIDVGIDKATLFEELGYKPHTGQWLAHNSKAKRRIPCCGRRWGKTHFAAREITAGLFVPDSMQWIVGPQYKTGEKEFRIVFGDIMRRLKLGRRKDIKRSYDVKQGNMRIEMPWNAIVEVVSADKADSLIGEGLDRAVMAEAAVHTKDIWEMYIEPALLDKDGDAIFPSTPRGHNWYEELWLMGQDPANDYNYESWRFPTWTNEAIFPLGLDDPRLQEIKNRVSEFHWLQEYCAEFTAIAGRIYEEFKREIHVTDISYNPFWANYLAFDFGFTNPFVCLDIMVDPSDNVYIWREYQVKRKTNGEHALILRNRESPPDYHVDGRFGDPRDPDAIATLSPIIGPVLARSSGVSWGDGIELVRRHLKVQSDGKPKLYIDRSCHHTIRQMEQLQTIIEREGKEAKEGQKDYDDHGPDAIRYFFAEMFDLGYAESSLSDIYDLDSSQSETSFQYQSQLTKTGTSKWL